MAEITRQAKAIAKDICIVVDGVSYAPHGLPDISLLGADIYLFSLYKTWGPHLGIMTIKPEWLARLQNQGHYFNETITRKKLLPAGPDHAQIAAAAGMAHYLDAVYAHHFSEPASSIEKSRLVNTLFREHEQVLYKKLMDCLKQRDDIIILGNNTSSESVSTISIIPKHKTHDEVYATLTAHKIMAGRGNFYAVRTLEGMNVSPQTGVIRLSFIHYTKLEEITQLIDALRSQRALSAT